MPAPTSTGRRRFREFLLAVALLHVSAIAVYHLFDIAAASASVQHRYAWTWMALTVVVVLVGLQRVRRARRSASALRRVGRPPTA